MFYWKGWSCPRLKPFFTGSRMWSYIDRWFVYFFLSTGGCSAVMWNTAVNVNAWLAIAVCNEARGGKRREGGKEGRTDDEEEKG